MESEIEIHFHFEKSSRIKKLFALRAAQFFFNMGNNNSAITKHRLGLPWNAFVAGHGRPNYARAVAQCKRSLRAYVLL